jgi:serine/threonine-protein kinase
VGARNDRYDVIRLLATGGMATVHLARDRVGGATVVLKRILPELANRPEFAAMFAEETRLMARLAPHPHVVQLLDAGAAHGGGQGAWQVLRFVDGPDLGVVMSQVARLGEAIPLALATWIAARIADGLQHVHDARDPTTGAPLAIVHRDVSPTNVLLSRDGDVCLADFGIARFAGCGVRTETGVLKGKAAYMSPEQCVGDVVDARSDVFALGVVLHELLTMRRLFSAPHPLAIIHRITRGPIPPPSAFNPHVDPALDDIVMRALERQPTRRYQTAAELAAALDAWRLSRGEHVDAAVCSRWLSRLLLALPPTVVDAAAVHVPIDAVAATTTSFAPGGLATVPDASGTLTTTTAPASTSRSWRRFVAGIAAVVATMGVGVGLGGGDPDAHVTPAPAASAVSVAVPTRVAVAEPRVERVDDVDAAIPVAVRAPGPRPGPKRGSTSPRTSLPSGRLSVRTTPPTVVSTADEVIDSTPFVARPIEPGLRRLTLTNSELGIRDEIVVKVPKNRNLALIATWTRVDDAWVLSTKTTREYR